MTVEATLENYTTELLFQTVEEIPDYLYHYTSLSTFLQIVNSQSVWASEASSLNDSDEISHVIRILETATLNNFAKICVVDNEWSHRIALQIRSIPRKFGRCFFSLCEGADELPLWRSYANHGKGVSIGFRTSELLKACERQEFQLRKVLYDRREQEEICQGFIQYFFQKFEIKDKIPQLSTAMLGVLDHFVQIAGPFMKNPTFSSEREWRLISSERVTLYDRRWQFRATDDRLIPYIQLNLPEIFAKLPSLETPTPYLVVMGPKCRNTPTSTALQMLNERIIGFDFGPSLSNSTLSD